MLVRRVPVVAPWILFVIADAAAAAATGITRPDVMLGTPGWTIAWTALALLAALAFTSGSVHAVYATLAMHAGLAFAGGWAMVAGSVDTDEVWLVVAHWWLVAAVSVVIVNALPDRPRSRGA